MSWKKNPITDFPVLKKDSQPQGNALTNETAHQLEEQTTPRINEQVLPQKSDLETNQNSSSTEMPISDKGEIQNDEKKIIDQMGENHSDQPVSSMSMENEQGEGSNNQASIDIKTVANRNQQLTNEQKEG